MSSKRVHHVFVKYRVTKTWVHETAFSDRSDALDERTDYRNRPDVLAARVFGGPDTMPFINRKLAELNGEVRTPHLSQEQP